MSIVSLCMTSWTAFAGSLVFPEFLKRSYVLTLDPVVLARNGCDACECVVMLHALHDRLKSCRIKGRISDQVIFVFIKNRKMLA